MGSTWRLRMLTGLLAAAGVTVLAACGSSGKPGDIGNGVPQGRGTAVDTQGRLGVVAGENVWGNIAAQIGGDQVAVTSIITNPNDDPHEYETDVKDAAAVANAALVIENGLGYDDFVPRLLSAAPSSDRVVLKVSTIVGASRNANPHLWYDPAYVDTTARAIERSLAARLPADASVFEANLAGFLAGEAQVEGVIGEIRARYAGTAIAYTERVPGYLVEAAGLRLVTPASFSQSIENGDDPSPIDNAVFESALTAHKARVLLYNAQVTDAITSHLAQVARVNGVPVVGVTETIPAGEKDFQSWQADQARALLAALGG